VRLGHSRRSAAPPPRPARPQLGWRLTRRTQGDREEAGGAASASEFRYLTEFQSHEPEFDYLKSQEIEEKINKIRWFRQGATDARFLLTTNDKTIKLWKVHEKRVRSLADCNLSRPVLEDRSASGSQAGPSASEGRGSFQGALRLPRVVASEPVLVARCRRAFSSAHAYHINSLSVSSDSATFISADDLRVNLWDPEASSSSFTIVDIKPDSMENLTEVITAAVFHPSDCSIFAYASSKGSIRLGDMRARALCTAHAKLFEEAEAPGTRSFFSEIIASVSDIQFGAGGRFLLSRDYLTLKLWDVAMESRPVATFSVHDGLRGKLCDLYENDAIFDKFECSMSSDGVHIATGTYSNRFRVFSTRGAEGEVRDVRLGRDDAAAPPPGMDYGSKLLHLAWQPQRNAVAACTGNSLYIHRA